MDPRHPKAMAMMNTVSHAYKRRAGACHTTMKIRSIFLNVTYVPARPVHLMHRRQITVNVTSRNHHSARLLHPSLMSSLVSIIKECKMYKANVMLPRTR